MDNQKYIIDCNAAPDTPFDWEVVEHKNGGQLEWPTEKIELWISEEQIVSPIEGNKLRKKLEGQKVMNACVLDFLLKNPELIPDEWKRKVVFFWGTIYRDQESFLHARCIYWKDDKWVGLSRWMGGDWYFFDYAALVQ